jgi:hypothetical protein
MTKALNWLMYGYGYRACSCGRVSQGASAPVFHNALDVCYLTAIPTLVYLDNAFKNVSHINSPISDDQEELMQAHEWKQQREFIMIGLYLMLIQTL